VIALDLFDKSEKTTCEFVRNLKSDIEIVPNRDTSEGVLRIDCDDKRRTETKGSPGDMPGTLLYAAREKA